MSLAKTHSDRSPQDLSHLIFQCGEVGSLTTLSVVPVIAGDSFQESMNGSFKFSPMRRNLSLDPKIEIFSFYVPHRHIYGDAWVDFIKKGMGDGVTPNVLAGTSVCYPVNLDQLAIGYEKEWGEQPNQTLKVAKWRVDGLTKIWANYFVRPNQSPSNPVSLGSCCHLKNMWTAPLNDEAIDPTLDVSDGNLNFMKLQNQAALFNNAQQRMHFATRYRDLMDSFGGGTTADVDQRPTLLAHTEFWGSGYDVDGTSETSLGQYTGRVNANFTHNVPRFFCMEHGAIWTVALTRFPPMATSETHYLNVREPTYEDISCDPTVVANMGAVNVEKAKLFPTNRVETEALIRVPHSQWYREHPNFVSSRYSELQGYPFLEAGHVGNINVVPDSYRTLFQTNQLKHWQINARSNAMVLRTIPTARQTFILDPDA